MWSNLLSDSLISSSAIARERFHKAFEDAQQTVDRHRNKKNNHENDSSRHSPNHEAADQTVTDSTTTQGNIAWASNIMDATRNTFHATRRVIEDEVAKANIQLPSSLSKLVDGDSSSVIYRSRDLSLPLDSDALRDADVVYITDRIVCMGHPAMSSNPEEEEGQQPYISAGRKLSAVSHLLRKRHGENNFMIWNLSEVEYDTSNAAFSGQLLMYRFPGSPTPPLGLLMRILLGMQRWLEADPQNVVVVHDMTGGGRASCVVAALLCWAGYECGSGGDGLRFRSIGDALSYVAKCKRLESVDAMTIPSQRRYYLTYFSNMLDGVRPNRPPIILKRITLSDAPAFEAVPMKEAVKFFVNEEGTSFEPVDGDNKDGEGDQVVGCAPYLQLFKAGKLLRTSCLPFANDQDKSKIPWCVSPQASNGLNNKKQQLVFHMDAAIQGDVFLRCRHMSSEGRRVSMFRVALHTGYIVAPKVLRIKKSEIDGACGDSRIPADFFIDLVFETCDADTASKFLNEEQVESNGTYKDPSAATEDSKAVESAEASSAVITPKCPYDAMLYDDDRVWVSISNRQKAITSFSEMSAKNDAEKSVGSIIGRVRDFSQKESKSGDNGVDGQENKGTKLSGMDAFSIGGLAGYNFEDNKPETSDIPAPPMQQERDELLEALNAIEEASPIKTIRRDDEEQERADTIVNKEKETFANEVKENSSETEELVVERSISEEKTKDEDINKTLDDEFGNFDDFDDSAFEDMDDDASLDDLEEFLTKM